MLGTVTFSAKRSNPHGVGTQCAVCMQHAVGVSAKRSLHTVGYTVGAQYAVGVSAKSQLTQ